jgi:hypothetical protein
MGAIITCGLSTQLMPKTLAQSNSEDAEPNAGTVGIAASQFRPWEAIFGNLFNAKKEDNSPTAGRAGTGAPRGGVCALTPGTIGTNQEIWSTRPMFVVKRQGIEPIQKIEVSSADHQKLLWNQDVPRRTEVFTTLYGGETPLQPNQIYNWVITYGNPGVSKQNSFSFKVMDEQKRDRITADLAKLEAELKAKGATTEEVALQRSQYFAQQELWSDALQEVYSVDNPSPALQERIQAITGDICFNLFRQNAAQSR